MLLLVVVAGCAKKGAVNDGVDAGMSEDDRKHMLSSEDFSETSALKDIFFTFDRSAIRPSDRSVLDNDARIIKRKNFRRVAIEGYCDLRGTEEYNLALGQRRADSVKSYLVAKGVSSDRVEAVSRGETDKFSTGNSEMAYRENRRAHFLVTR